MGSKSHKIRETFRRGTHQAKNSNSAALWDKCASHVILKKHAENVPRGTSKPTKLRGSSLRLRDGPRFLFHVNTNVSWRVLLVLQTHTWKHEAGRLQCFPFERGQFLGRSS